VDNKEDALIIRQKWVSTTILNKVIRKSIKMVGIWRFYYLLWIANSVYNQYDYFYLILIKLKLRNICHRTNYLCYKEFHISNYQLLMGHFERMLY